MAPHPSANPQPLLLLQKHTMSTSGLKALISPSLLACDFAHLAKEIKRVVACGADWIHVDVMDGHFVPNITIGVPIVRSLHAANPEWYLDCHLMVADPARWVKDFADAGADMFTFHLESVEDPKSVIDLIRTTSMKVGLAVKPKTPVEDMMPFVPFIDMALIMTVEPGFGGQSFMGDMLPKVKALRTKFPHLDIQVDGGVGPKNIDLCSTAGSNVIVSGTAVFKAEDPCESIACMKKSIAEKLLAPGL